MHHMHKQKKVENIATYKESESYITVATWWRCIFCETLKLYSPHKWNGLQLVLIIFIIIKYFICCLSLSIPLRICSYIPGDTVCKIYVWLLSDISDIFQPDILEHDTFNVVSIVVSFVAHEHTNLKSYIE